MIFHSLNPSCFCLGSFRMTKKWSNVNSPKAKITIKLNVHVYGCVRTTNKVLSLYELTAEQNESMYDVLV